MKRESLKLDETDWLVLKGIAAECGSEYLGKPSWRRLFREIASGDLTVVQRPNKRLQAFHVKMRRPMLEAEKKKQIASWAARRERDRLRQEQKRRAAGIAPRGAQDAMDEATGCGFWAVLGDGGISEAQWRAMYDPASKPKL